MCWVRCVESGKVAQFLDQLAQCLAAVREPVLLLRIELGRGLAQPGQIEMRIIAEAVAGKTSIKNNRLIAILNINFKNNTAAKSNKPEANILIKNMATSLFYASSLLDLLIMYCPDRIRYDNIFLFISLVQLFNKLMFYKILVNKFFHPEYNGKIYTVILK